MAEAPDLGCMVPHDAPHQGVVIEVEPLEDIWLRRRAVRRTGTRSCWSSTRSPIRTMSGRSCAPPRRSVRSQSSPRIAIRRRKAERWRRLPGALERVPWVRVVNLARALEEIAEAGFWRIGLAGEAERTEGSTRSAARGASPRRGRSRNAQQHTRALRRARQPADYRAMSRASTCPMPRNRALRRASPDGANDRIDQGVGRRACAPGEGIRQSADRIGHPEPGPATPAARPASDDCRPAGQRRRCALDVEQADCAIRRPGRSRRINKSERRRASRSGLPRQKAGYARSLAA